MKKIKNFTIVNERYLKVIFCLFFSCLLFVLSLFIFNLSNWLHRCFGNLTIEQILFFISTPLEGINPNTSLSFKFDLIYKPIIIFLFLFAFLNVLFYIKNIFKKYINLLNKHVLKIVFCFAILFFIIIYISLNAYKIQATKFYNSQTDIKSGLIAHAGGEIDYKLYTNSLEAIQKSIDWGYKYIELDLQVSEDGKIIAYHDIERYKNMISDENIQGIYLKDFNNKKLYSEYTPVDEEKIKNLLNQNLNLVLVTDKLEDFSKLNRLLKYKERLIVEVFSYEKYNEALKEGFLYPALNIKTKQQVRQILRKNIKIITLDYKLFIKNEIYFRFLHRMGVTIMVFGDPLHINKEIFLNKYKGRAFSLAYVDFYPE